MIGLLEDDYDYFSRALYTLDIGQNDITAAFANNLTLEQVKSHVPRFLQQFSYVIKVLHLHYICFFHRYITYFSNCNLLQLSHSHTILIYIFGLNENIIQNQIEHDSHGVINNSDPIKFFYWILTRNTRVEE